jgi:23S rRNA U2552 (ribose-2'-O)-methylase RlmE/FtsJ
MPETPLSLDAIGVACNTDKSSIHHDYLAFYERFFEKWRLKKLRILEVGVFNGASLRTWARYFPQAEIIGADINFRAKRHEAERIKIEILDQANVQNLVDIGLKHGPFDIVIEDGSHMWEHQTTTLKTLFPFVKPGGLYVVEDLQTNFGEMTKHFQGAATESCVDYLKRLMEYRVADEQLDIAREEDPFLRSYGRAMEMMVFFRHACLIEKGPGLRPSFTTLPLAELSWDTHMLPLGLVAHFGNIGDRENKTAPFLNGQYCRQFIQGFAVTATEEVASGLEYRVRLPRGEWTDWVKGNVYAGSRGRFQNLTGYSIRTASALQAGFEVTALGAFGPDGPVIRAAAGEDCVPPEGSQPLSAMQILVKRR